MVMEVRLSGEKVWGARVKTLIAFLLTIHPSSVLIGIRIRWSRTIRRKNQGGNIYKAQKLTGSVATAGNPEAFRNNMAGCPPQAGKSRQRLTQESRLHKWDSPPLTQFTGIDPLTS